MTRESRERCHIVPLRSPALATLIVTVAPAFIGCPATCLNSLRLAQRQARSARVNRQLGEFHGPLFALVEANTRIYRNHYEKYVRSDGR